MTTRFPTITTLNGKVWQWQPCEQCHGSGFRSMFGDGEHGTCRTCKSCHGIGRLRFRIGVVPDGRAL